MRIAAYAVGLMLGLSGPEAIAAVTAGKVVELEGEVQVLDAAGAGHALKPGATVRVGDIIQTGKTGQVHLRMVDDAYYAVRPNTRMVILTYRAANKEDDGSVINLLKGSFRAVSGWIGQLHPANYKVTTPTASIGIRGTDHEPVYVPEDEATPDSPAGTYDRVTEGGTFIESEGASVEVKPGFAGFAALRERPRLLDAIPRFLENRPRLDERLEAIKPELKVRVQEKLERLRELRSQIRENRLREIGPIRDLPRFQR